MHHLIIIIIIYFCTFYICRICLKKFLFLCNKCFINDFGLSYSISTADRTEAGCLSVKTVFIHLDAARRLIIVEIVGGGGGGGERSRLITEKAAIKRSAYILYTLL